MKGFETIETSDLRRRRESGPIRHFWNVLTDDFFTGELIPGSRRVPLDGVVAEARRLELEDDAEIIVYCSGPDCPQSTAAAEKLAAVGFRNVHEFDGGLAAWKEAGLPVEEVPVGTAAE